MANTAILTFPGCGGCILGFAEAMLWVFGEIGTKSNPLILLLLKVCNSAFDIKSTIKSIMKLHPPPPKIPQ